LGGYPSDSGSREQEQIRQYIRQSVGKGGTWTAPARPRAPRQHPWSGEDFPARLACELTAKRVKGTRWYSFYDQWYQKDDRRFFVNYYYKELMIVDERALELVRSKALSQYALMAAPEFFAELYATINGRDRRQFKRKERLDEDIKDFFKALNPTESEETRQDAEVWSGVNRRRRAHKGKPVLIA
jgi:hypothetical protein